MASNICENNVWTCMVLFYFMHKHKVLFQVHMTFLLKKSNYYLPFFLNLMKKAII